MNKEKADLFHQPPPGQQFVYIGIDPGVMNGLAIYSKERGLRVQQVSFWKLFDLLNEKILPAHKEKRIVVKAIVEANHKNKFSYKGRINGKSREIALTMARNAGMNQGYCKLICEWFTHNGIDIEEMVPRPNDKKWNREFFKALTGIDTAETNEHSRDAARFIGRYWLNNLNK